MVLIHLKLNPHHPRMLCTKFRSWEDDFWSFVDIFPLFHYYLPYEKGMALHLNKHDFPSPKDALCQVWWKMAQWFLRRRRFINFFSVFSLFPYHLHLKKVGAIDLNKLESSSPKNVLCQVWLKLALWFLRKRFLQSVDIFLLFRYFLPLEKDKVLYLNKLETPSPKNALCQVWLKLGLWFLRTRFLKFVNVFWLFRYYLQGLTNPTARYS